MAKSKGFRSPVHEGRKVRATGSIILRRFYGVALLLWCLWLTWLCLGGPTQADPEPPNSLWSAMFRQAGYYQDSGHFTRLIQTYPALLKDWSNMTSGYLFLQILIGIAGLGLMTLVGRWLAACFIPEPRRLERIPLWLTLGMGAVGVAEMLPALAGVFNSLTAWIILVLLAAGVRYAAHRSWPLTPRDGNWRSAFQLPESATDRVLVALMAAAVLLITFLTFYHGVLFPETYWDSLILYLGYARGIFLEGGFPTKVVGQVGVGLGANYPHLFEMLGATVSAWSNHWSPVYQQLMTPVAGAAALILVFATVLRLSGSFFHAILIALLLRVAPYFITYHSWSSNYALVMLYSAAFFWLALRFLETRHTGFFVLATFVAAFAGHINYLMLSLWLCWFVLLLGAGWPRPLDILKEKGAALWSLFALGFGSIWYVRNWIVTGNPVYAFFTWIFRGTRHVNPEVMESAAIEWQRHGDGIGVADSLNLAARMGLPDSDILDRLIYTWPFFANQFSSSYKWFPVFLPLVVPGIVLFFVSFFRHRTHAKDVSRRLGLLAICYGAILFGYHYFLGAFYLYHLLGAFVIFGILAFFALRPVPRPLLRAVAVWALFCAFMPGIPWALMGPKVGRPDLVALRHPGMPEPLFYRLRFGKAPLMWEKINTLCKGTGLLTHENRHLVFDPSIQLVHMDDWEVQKVWDVPDRQKLLALQRLNVQYYLKVPYEADHPVNARLGHARWVESGLLEEVFRAGDQALYRFPWARQIGPREKSETLQ